MDAFMGAAKRINELMKENRAKDERLKDMEELFWLLKKDFDLDENHRTYEWEEKAESMGLNMRRKELLEADQYETFFRLARKMGVEDDE